MLREITNVPQTDFQWVWGRDFALCCFNNDKLLTHSESQFYSSINFIHRHIEGYPVHYDYRSTCFDNIGIWHALGYHYSNVNKFAMLLVCFPLVIAVSTLEKLV